MKASKRVIGWDAVRQISNRLNEIERRIIVIEASKNLSLSGDHRREVWGLSNERKLLRLAQSALMTLLC